MRRLLFLLVLVVACSGDNAHKQTTIHARGMTMAGTPQAPDARTSGDAAPVDPKATPLTETMAAPYWTTPDELEAARRFALENWQLARAAFETALAATTDEDRKAHIRLMIGLCAENTGDWDKATLHLQFAHDHLPLLADFTGYHAASAAYFAHTPEIARTLAQAVAPDSIVGYDAEMLVGDVLRDAGDWSVVAGHYEGYLSRRPHGPRRSEARFHLAEAMEHIGKPWADAVALYRKIAIDDPLSSWATRAHDRVVAIAKANKLDLAKLESQTAAEHITRGKELFDAMRNPASERAFDDALHDPKLSAADRCVAAYHKAQSRFKARDRKGAAGMFDDAADACKAAGNTDLEIKSNYQAGRSYSFFGEHDTAIKRYQAAQAIDPKHSYADDALLREGEEWTALGDDKQVLAVLSSLPTKFPDGDNVAEAMWRLGWHAWRDQKYDDAITWWKKQLELVPRDDSYYGEGEAQYWLGRAYAAQGKPQDAIASWQAAVRIAPAAYYALLSLNRLRETDAKAYAAMLTEISTAPKGFDPKAPAFAFRPRLEWGTPGFLRAMELLRLGLGVPAERELKKLGLSAPADKKRVDDPDKIEKLWAMAYLYDRAGRYATSIWPTRWHILDYRKQWPIGTNRARWLVAYPKAYWELLTRHAAANQVPIAMQIAIVREESGFDPLDESYANAIGLTQMIPPTAKDFAKGTGIDPTRENLRDPEKNVTIGGRFLGFLYKQWDGFTLLVPPSYNAGPAGVRKMLRARGTWDADEFVEGIADDQARNYTKRVLGSFFTYTWLYDHDVPVIPNTIPKALLPK
ncbi:MAG TPA: transglycosylase SLT domain-containing protein [Kofleriaceae bacterium]|jgi:soluble lytic murein transglycosylase|nr:transglycosylase SLT domain-containing protein [Kofleriaceae bacterium]